MTTMKVTDNTHAIALIPQFAVILYGEKLGGRQAHSFATAHELTADKKGWRMGAGAPLRIDALSNALFALLGAGRPAILPANILRCEFGVAAGKRVRQLVLNGWIPPQTLRQTRS